MTEPMWTYSGKPFLTQGGYLAVWIPKLKRRMFIHRVVIENSLGRVLTQSEVVHHKNGIRTDNRLENLEVLSKEDHLEAHGDITPFVTVACPVCGFERTVRESVRDHMRHGACIKCKNIITNQTRFGGYMHFWADWDTCEISEPFSTRREAYLNRMPGRSIVSYNSKLDVIRSDRAYIPDGIAAAIRARKS